MRALVTGGTGFVGVHLLRLLVKEKVKVAVLMRPNSNAWRIADILADVEVIHGDLTAIELAKDSILSFSPEIIFHLGWYGVGNRYRNDPAQIQNLGGSLDLLKTASESGCNIFVGMGSQAEYGPYDRPISEDFQTRPTTVYGVTKLCLSLLARELCEKLGLRFVWLRLFSAYGPMEDSSWLIPYVIHTLRQGEKPSLTLGKQLWDYLYVEDAAEAIYQVALNPQAQGVFNLGSGEANSIHNIVERIRDMIDPRLPLGFGEVPYRPDQVMHLQADIAKLRKGTGWEPQTSLYDGLRHTVEWYRHRMEVRP
jgi:nucleoside-diphosphate-sugar epimerase